MINNANETARPETITDFATAQEMNRDIREALTAIGTTITVNRGNWTGKTTTVTFWTSDDGDTEMFIACRPDEFFTIVRTPSEDLGATFGVLADNRATGITGFSFDENDHDVFFSTMGIEREATGEHAVIEAATQVICNI